MFENLRRHPKIIVTGPQRSGTTIAAKMIARDTGYEYVDEDELRRDDLATLRLLLRVGRRFVVHCPALCRFVHEVADDETAVVLMRRPIEEIVASQRRICWRGGRAELRRYGLSAGVIAAVKYRFWDEQQRGRIAHAYEIDYASLAAHPLWVPARHRRHFAPRQTERTSV